MKTAEIKVRLTDIEKEIFKDRAKALNMTISDYVKYCCLINPPNPYGFEREEEYKTKK